MQEEEELVSIITEYSKAYEKLQKFQEEHEKIIPKGDQKTGVIGEYFGLKILKEIYPESEVELSTNHSQKGYDVRIKKNDSTEYIQIKTISWFSDKGMSSKINLNFKDNNKIEKELDGLLIILLEKNLLEGQYLLLNKEEIKDHNGKCWSRSKTKQHKSIYGFNFSKKGLVLKNNLQHINSTIFNL
jgi:hypothetical protein